MDSNKKNILIVILVILLLVSTTLLILKFLLKEEPIKKEVWEDEPIKTTETITKLEENPKPLPEEKITEVAGISYEEIRIIANKMGFSDLKDGAIVNVEIYKEANFTVTKEEGEIKIASGSNPKADLRLTTGSYAVQELINTPNDLIEQKIRLLKEEKQIGISETKSLFTLYDKGYSSFVSRFGL